MTLCAQYNYTSALVIPKDRRHNAQSDPNNPYPVTVPNTLRVALLLGGGGGGGEKVAGFAKVDNIFG